MPTPPLLQRRGFLKGAAAAALAHNPVLAAPTKMFISMNGSLLASPIPWPDFVRLAGRLGYGGADLNLDAAMKAGVEATRALFAEAKIRPGVAGLPVPIGGEEPAFQTGLKRLDEAAKFVAAVDCPRMMTVLMPAWDKPKAEVRPMLRDRLSAISEILLNSRVRLGLEFLGPQHFRTAKPHEFIWRMRETLEFARECGPNIGLQLDAWHWHHAGGALSDIYAAGKPRVVSIHVSDAKKQAPEEVRDNQRLMPGEGMIDLVGFFRALAGIGYEDAISPEPLGRIPAGTPPEEGARLGLETTRAVMQKAGLV